MRKNISSEWLIISETHIRLIRKTVESREEAYRLYRLCKILIVIITSVTCAFLDKCGKIKMSIVALMIGISTCVLVISIFRDKIDNLCECETYYNKDYK